MSVPLRVILIEDSRADVELLLRELRRGFPGVESVVVDNELGLRTALARGGWDAVISDYVLPSLDVLAALAQVRRRAPDLPFIIVSGVIGEEKAVEAMRLGADDYVMKSNLARLAPAIERERLAARTRRELRERERDFLATMRALTRRVVTLQEDERRTLAAELHDDVGQSLSALGINLSLVEARLDAGAGEVRPLLADSRHLLEELGRYVRHVIADLRPAVLDDYGLVPALQWSREAFEKRTGIACAVSGPEARLAPALETVLFRIAREALANAAKHSEARRIELQLRLRAAGGALWICDDGRGFDAALANRPGAAARWGLLLMRERMASVGGRLRILSAPGKGTCVVAAWRT
jgi:signal transduction histidine kinase